MQQLSPDVLIQFVPIVLLMVLFSVPSAIMANLLAKEKGRNIARWTVLGAIPFINWICFWFFIGAANLRLERKIDELLKHCIESAPNPRAGLGK